MTNHAIESVRVKPLDKELEQKLREALRFSASRSVMTSDDEARILSALESATQPAVPAGRVKPPIKALCEEDIPLIAALRTAREQVGSETLEGENIRDAIDLILHMAMGPDQLPARTLPVGWKLVPVKITQEMKERVRKNGGNQAVAFALAAWPDLLAAAPTLEAAVPAGWTHRHKKRDTKYAIVGHGLLQVDGDLDMEKVTIYRGEDGEWWVRPDYEFNDGRFELLAAAPEPEARP